MANIFLFGRACSGKSEVGRYLASKHGYVVFALADEIKREIARRIGRKPTKADRALMIDVGQTYKRLYGESVWIDALVAGNNDAFDAFCEGRCLVEDGRYLVEHDAFARERGFVSILVHAPDRLRRERMLSRDGVDQTSMIGSAEDEISDIPFDHAIVNDGSLERLYESVDRIVAKIREEAK